MFARIMGKAVGKTTNKRERGGEIFERNSEAIYQKAAGRAEWLARRKLHLFRVLARSLVHRDPG